MFCLGFKTTTASLLGPHLSDPITSAGGWVKATPWIYTFDFTSISQHWLPWPCKLGESRNKILPWAWALFSLMSWQAHWTIIKYWGSVLSFLAKVLKTSYEWTWIRHFMQQPLTQNRSDCTPENHISAVSEMMQIQVSSWHGGPRKLRSSGDLLWKARQKFTVKLLAMLSIFITGISIPQISRTVRTYKSVASGLLSLPPAQEEKLEHRRQIVFIVKFRHII